MQANKIEFGELRITDLAKKHLQECVDNNWVSIGAKTALFEKEWEKLFTYNSTVMVNSGTSADIAACMALYDHGAKPGDYIICPALSFIATANAIRAAGFVPLFVDVRKETLGINEEQVKQVLESMESMDSWRPYKIVAIMAVNLMGKPCRLDKLQELSKKFGLKLIVDNCEAYGSRFYGKYSLEYADFETTSHYIAHIICCGEGGTVSTNNSKDADLIRSIRSHGRLPGSLEFNHFRYGLNLKPTDMCASIGLGEIDDFWHIFKKRKENLYALRDATLGYEDKAYFVEEDPGDVNAPHGFSITLKAPYDSSSNMLKLRNILDTARIAHKKNFGSMPHHPAFNYLAYSRYLMPNAQYIGKYGLHVGCHYWLSQSDIDRMCDAIRLGLESLT